MPTKNKRGYIEVDDLKVAEIINISKGETTTEEDTSTIGNDENDFNSRTEVDFGPDTITANCYRDRTDPAQALLKRGARVKVVDFPDGNEPGLPKETYSEMLVTSALPGERAFATYSKVTYLLKQTGTFLEEIIT